MDEEHGLRLEFSLKRVSVIAVAASYWEMPQIKNERKKYFANYGDREYPEPYGLEWNNIMEIMMRHLDSLNLPQKVTGDIKKVIVQIGKKIYWWTLYVTMNLIIDYKHVESVYWTAYGTIDEKKIVELAWLPNPDFPGAADNMHNKFCIYSIACSLAEEDFLLSNLENAKSLVKELFPKPNINPSKWKVHSIMTILLSYIGALKLFPPGKGGISDVIDLYNEVRRSPSPDAKLFDLCVSIQQKEAAEYFYKKLKDEDKLSVLLSSATDFVVVACDELEAGSVQKSPDMLLYLINKMPKNVSYQFLKENGIVCFLIFLRAWPYRELCLPLTNLFYCNLSEKGQKYLIFNIIKTMLVRDVRYCPIEKEACQDIFKDILEKTSDKVKYEYFVQTKINVYNFFLKSDFSSIHIVINDSYLKQYKTEVTDISSLMSQYLTEHGGNIANIINYMRVVKSSDDSEMKKIFKEKSEFLQDLIVHKRLDIADEFLNWQYESEKERNEAKLKIDSEMICSKFKSAHDYGSAAEFLKWMFSTKEERTEIKSTIEPVNIRKEFCILWVKNFPKGTKFAKTECKKLLKFCMDSDEMGIFIKEKLIEDEMFLKIFCDSTNSPDSLDTIDGLLKFCLSADKRKEFKRKIRDNIYYWIELYGEKENKMVIADAIVRWIFFQDDERMDEVIRKYINSKKGAKLLMSILGNNDILSTDIDSPVIILSEWVNMYGDRKKIKNEVKNLQGCDENTRILCIDWLLKASKRIIFRF